MLSLVECVFTSSETTLGRLDSEPTALGGSPKPPAGDEARPPHPLRKAASVSIKGRWKRFATYCRDSKGRLPSTRSHMP